MEVLLSSVTASASASRWIPNLSSIRPLSTSSFCGISSSNSQPQQKFPISRFPIISSASSPSQGLAAFSVPLAASLAVLLWSAAPGRESAKLKFFTIIFHWLASIVSGYRLVEFCKISDIFAWIYGLFAVEAGILSGSSGLESLPGPQLPKIDFLSRWNGT